MSEYLSMREIGADIGMTSHAVGRKLKELGLRTGDGKPSPEAFRKKIVEQRPSTQPGTYYWVWDANKVKGLLISSNKGGV